MGRKIQLRTFFQQFHGIHAGHADICQNNVRRFVQNCIIGFQAIFTESHQFNIVLFPVNDGGNGFPDHPFIVCDH